MKANLKAALLWDPLLDGSTIDVAVINRIADLSGTVSSNFQKAEAQDVASKTKGLVLVRNHLKVEPEFPVAHDEWPYDPNYGWPFMDGPPYGVSEIPGPLPHLNDEQIKKNLEDRLFWSPFVAPDDIEVTVAGGVATLTGTVETWVGWGEV